MQRFEGENRSLKRCISGYNECVHPAFFARPTVKPMTRLCHPFLALIATSADRELTPCIEYLEEENKILRARIPGQVHTKPEERKRLLKLGQVLRKAFEELVTIVKPATFYRWIRDELEEARKKRKGGQRKSSELRELVAVAKRVW